MTTIRKEWSCVNSKCEETVVKCTDNVCKTEKSKFESENYEPEIPIVEPSKIDIEKLPEIVKIPNIAKPDTENPFNQSGLIDLVTNFDNFSYYWSNSKHINKKCQNKVCTTTTKTCKNGKCDEKIVIEMI